MGEEVTKVPFRRTLADIIAEDGGYQIDIQTQRDLGYDLNLVKDVGNSQIIIIDDIVNYIFRTSKKETWKPSDFPCVKLPYPKMFFDMLLPSNELIAPGNGDFSFTIPRHFRRLGVFAEEFPIPNYEAWVLRLRCFTYNPGVNIDNSIPREHRRSVYGPCLTWSVYPHPDGSLGYIGAKDDLRDGIIDMADSTIFTRDVALFVDIVPVLFAISMMHCKNVSVERHEASKAARKAHLKRHGREPFRWHTLNIEPMTRILSAHTEAGASGLRSALHLCRGHFKDYRESGLFGKHKGLYWWDHAVRGSASEGVILKNYNIIPPATAES